MPGDKENQISNPGNNTHCFKNLGCNLTPLPTIWDMEQELFELRVLVPKPLNTFRLDPFFFSHTYLLSGAAISNWIRLNISLIRLLTLAP